MDHRDSAHVQPASRRHGKQTDGEHEPQWVDHGRKKAKNVQAVSYQLSAISYQHLS
jgi:hypothetical protein